MNEPAHEVEAAPAVAAEIFGPALDRATRYVELLATAGVQRGLIGPREAARIWTRHVLNSAIVAELLPASARVVDIGSGAGLPGIPLALARDDCSVVLVEPLQRRVRFLTEVVNELGLVRCTVVRGRAQDVVASAGAADAVVSRAVAPLARLAGWCAPLLRIGGEMLALKGLSAREELLRDEAELTRFGLVRAVTQVIGAGVLTEPTTVIRAVRESLPERSSRASRGRS